MNVIYTDGKDKRFIELCYELDQFLNDCVGTEKQGEYNQYNTLEDIHNVILLMEDDEAVACGSFKEFENGAAEIKRVYVKPNCRRRGLSKILLNTLEAYAKETGYTKLILETGNQLKAATKMYSNIGYNIRDNFGQYVGMPDSICMEKLL
jgi:hypothetical protein